MSTQVEKYFHYLALISKKPPDAVISQRTLSRKYIYRHKIPY